MPTDTKLNNLVINYLTQAQYDAIATKNENELYLTPDSTDATFSKARYKHVVNLSCEGMLNAIFTGYNSSNEPVNTYEKLVKLFGGEGIELHGKVIVNGEVKDTKYLDLHGGGINTDNIAYWKGDNNSPLALVTINLDQFVGLTIADSVCLPK